MAKDTKNKPVALKVFEEQAQISKKTIEKGKVSVHKKVHAHDENVNVSLNNEQVQIEKVVVNQYVDAVPPVRYEGNTTIIPVIKEVAVVQKRILLTEEIRITKHIVVSEEEKTVPLRREEIIIETSERES